MTDIKELFDMVTQQTEPDLDSWKEQEDRQRKKARNRKVGAFAVAAAFVAVGAFAIIQLQGGDPEGPANGSSPSVDVRPTIVSHSYLDIATGERAPVAVDLTGARIPEVSPNGQQIAYGTCCLPDDAIYVADLTGATERVTLTLDGMNGYAPTWIDDETILFQGRDNETVELGDLYTVDITTGVPTMVVDLPDERNGTSWIVRSDVSPDGSTVLFHLPRGAGGDVRYDLWTVPLVGGEPALLRQDAGYAQYTADGSIVYIDQPIPYEGDEIWVMDGDGSNARMLVSEDSLTWPQVSPDGTTVAYGNDGTVEIVDIATGDVTSFEELGEQPAWYGNDRLII